MKLIVAVDEEGGIARDGKIPWFFPEDIKFFRFMTMYNEVYMGRKTQDTLLQPLSKRQNFVLTRNEASVKQGFRIASDGYLMYTSGFVIGGAEIYDLCLSPDYIDSVEDIYVTRVVGTYGCDRFFFVPDSFEKIAKIALSEACTVERYCHAR